MVRFALLLLLLALLLNAVGFISNSSILFEIPRVVGAVFLAAGIAMLLYTYARTPDPPPA
jgi:hypothetical protein